LRGVRAGAVAFQQGKLSRTDDLEEHDLDLDPEEDGDGDFDTDTPEARRAEPRIKPRP
jgi:hypothetical protein